MQSTALQIDARGLAARLARVLWLHRWLLAIMFIYFATGFAVLEYVDRPEKMTFSLYSELVLNMTGVFAIGFAVLYPLYVMLFVRPANLLRYLAADIRTNWLTVERLAGGGLILLLLPRFISLFTVFKTLIPVINPYAWDPQFAQWDRWMHGGVDPWRLLQPILGAPWISSGINFFYHMWIFVLYGILLWQAFSVRDPRLRMQFFLTFVLVWSLLGGLMATLLSSVGPVYFGRVTGLEDPFLPLVDYLQAANETAPIWALQLHDWLWRSHILGEYNFGTGISAMPSVHVAAAVLFALLGWRSHRLLGIALTAFAVMIMIGSVHLAWHYALDGYVAAILTYGLWRAAGWLVAQDPAFDSGRTGEEPPAALSKIPG